VLPGRIDRLETDAEGLAGLRAEAAGDGAKVTDLHTAYSTMIEHAFAVSGALTGEERTSAASEARVVLELARAREALAQEQAILAAGRAAGTLTKDQYALFVGAVATQRQLLAPAVADLRPGHRDAYNTVLQSGSYESLQAIENRVRSAGPGASAVSAGFLTQWDGSAKSVLEGLAKAEKSAGTAAVSQAERLRLGHARRLRRRRRPGPRRRTALAARLRARRARTHRRTPRPAQLRPRSGRPPAAAGHAAAARRAGRRHRRRGTHAAPRRRRTRQVGTALTAVQRAALKAASERAELLSGISGVYVSIARRSQVLLHRQLDLLDGMEQRQRDQAELQDLYRIDYLATRMRRHSESLLILSGIAPGRGWRDPIPLSEVLRAAVAEIENASRVRIWATPRVSVAGGSVADVIHLLAELVENASAFSPPSTQVQLRAARVRGGLLIEVEDSGFGMKEDAMAEANRKIRSEKVDLLDAKQIGLIVVNRLAERQGVSVELRSSGSGGVTAGVLIPENLVRDDMPVHDRALAESGAGGRSLAPASALIPPQRGQ
jgi:anti-sigma regulatory factor (Ser/Thr protein kinase)